MLDNSYKGIIYFLAFLAHGLSIVGCDVEIYFNVVINIRATTKRLALMFKWKHQLYCIYQIALLLMYCTAHLFFFSPIQSLASIPKLLSALQSHMFRNIPTPFGRRSVNTEIYAFLY